MSHRYQKGSKRPDPTVTRRGARAWNPSPGAVPWPELADGTPWKADLGPVTHVQVPESIGALEGAVAWESGEWVATVAWEDGMLAQIPLGNLMLSTDE